MFINDMHHIQREILTSLAANSPQRFSQLQPPRIPNNTFSYHLKKLVLGDYVVLSDGGYMATRKALKTLQYDGGHVKKTNTPALISMLYVKNDRDQILLIRRSNRPFVDWYGLPSGLIHQGEELEAAALRELFEKTTYSTKKAKQIGVLDFKYLEKDSADLFVHAIAFIYSVTIDNSGEELADLETRYGKLMWSNLKNKKILPEVFTVAEMVEKKKPFIHSVNFDEPE